MDGSGDPNVNDGYMTGASNVYMGEDSDEHDEKHNGDDSGDDRDEGPLREQDRFLPIANVSRIMKKSIPNSGKIAKDAKECVQECVSEFISFITSEASERCHQEKRKTINGEDILFAMNTLSFDNYVEPLKIYLQKYRDASKGERSVLGGQEERLVELGSDDSYGGLSGTIITTDPSAQHGIIYTGDYTAQVQSLEAEQFAGMSLLAASLH